MVYGIRKKIRQSGYDWEELYNGKFRDGTKPIAIVKTIVEARATAEKMTRTSESWLF